MSVLFSHVSHAIYILYLLKMTVRLSLQFSSVPLRAGVPNLFLTMYHFSIPTNEHVPPQHFNS